MIWLLVLYLKEDMVECATLCVKSEVILKYLDEPDMTENTLPGSPSTQIYTMIRLGMATALFVAFYMAYSVILLLIKNRISKDFLLSSYAKRFQHIIEALNMPESFEDWDSEHNLDVQVKLYIPSTLKTLK